MGVELAVPALYVATPFSLLEPIQRQSYGVLMFALALAFVFFGVTQWIEEHPKLLEQMVFTRLHKKKCWQISALVILPIFFSWLENDSIIGAVSPPDYWKGQANTTDTTCDGTKSIVASAADSYRVTENKFNMGIATVDELKSSLQVLKILADTNKECLSSAQTRRNEIARHLKRLGLEKLVVVK